MSLWKRGQAALKRLVPPLRTAPEDTPQIPWLDRTDWEAGVEKRLLSGGLTQGQAAWCRAFARDGYLVFEKLIPEDQIDRSWRAYERFYEAHREEFHPSNLPGDPWPERYLNTHFSIPEIAEILHHPGLLEMTDLLFGRSTRPFQSITSHKGTEQGAHSDSIHMTTRPPGYLLAAWIACEDIHPDSGPLDYYPGSHRLPYVLSEDVGISRKEFDERQHEVYHERYEPRIRELISEHHLQRREFLARKGDVLVWHANLLHGAGIRRDLDRSRKSLICHYFAHGVECFHDLSGHAAAFSGGEGVAVPPVSQR